MIDSIAAYREQFLEYLGAIAPKDPPDGLYEPVRYILEMGGKRMRPVLVLLSADLFGASPKEALPAAAAVEVFHNFSLIHDDIMDAAPLRRGKPTVHKRWDLNTGILSGDAMLILAYQQLEAYGDPQFGQLIRLFSRTALEVCEGQQYDMDFENRDDVALAEYQRMIELKTAVLLGCALQMGAIVGGAEAPEQAAVYRFGIALGMAFQLQDDYLDAFGDPERFGKQVGGDIIENKKTYLYLKALEEANPDQQRELTDLYSITPSQPGDKVKRVLQLFRSTGADEKTRERIAAYTDQAFQDLEALSGNPKAKAALHEFGSWLLKRDF
ncbi:polyprenyl synthetase family protein [Robiginitalea sediminis]|uniref:polyprenyl synthetase family protein n=1 Tax=Robiginitalea sediminis TaxID=1982593 RepID=UPI000B4B9159|nr:polyprenyl synthetase family protein [Robiginitalea sediminis]